MGQIIVTGKGRLSLHPDTIVVKFRSSAVYTDYAETIAMASKATKDLKALIAKAGIDGELLKTRNLDIRPKHETYYDNKDHRHERFVGYEYNHSSQIKIENDNKLLGKLIYVVSTSPLDVNFDISYTVKDIEKAKNDLLREAVKDAKMKAEVLSDVVGVKLKEIKSIDYSWDELEIYSHPLRLEACEYRSAEPSDSLDIDINAEDIEISDTVSIVWEID